jgi:hypothetical protein
VILHNIEASEISQPELEPAVRRCPGQNLGKKMKSGALAK